MAKFQQAETLFRQGELAGAGKLCQEVLGLQPMHFEALHLLGIIASRTGQMSEAIALLGKAIAAMPGSAEAYNSLGNVLAQLGRPEQALVSYAQAIRFRPDFAEARDNHGRMLQEPPRAEVVVADHEAAIHCCSPTPALEDRWRSPLQCPLCSIAAFQCADPDDNPATGGSGADRNDSVGGSVFEC